MHVNLGGHELNGGGGGGKGNAMQLIISVIINKGDNKGELPDLCFALCRFSQVRFITPSHLTHNLFFYFQ